MQQRPSVVDAFICLGTLPLGKIAGAEALTARDSQIVRLLASGMTDPAIAAALFISPRTVENHVARIFAKLGVHSRTAAATAAIAAGFIQLNRPTPDDG